MPFLNALTRSSHYAYCCVI